MCQWSLFISRRVSPGHQRRANCKHQRPRRRGYGADLQQKNHQLSFPPAHGQLKRVSQGHCISQPTLPFKAQSSWRVPYPGPRRGLGLWLLLPSPAVQNSRLQGPSFCRASGQPWLVFLYPLDSSSFSPPFLFFWPLGISLIFLGAQLCI